METRVQNKSRKCPKPLINTFAWAIWLKHLALRHIWLLYYKGSVLSIGFVSFFQFFSFTPPFFVFQQKKLLISYPTGNYRKRMIFLLLTINQKNSIPISVSPCAGAVGPAISRLQASRIVFTLSGGYCPFPTSIRVPEMIRTML